MGQQLNYQNVDIVLSLFYSLLPGGADYFILTSECGFPEEERHLILKFLLSEELIIKSNDDITYILSQKGIDAVKRKNAIENFLNSLRR